MDKTLILAVAGSGKTTYIVNHISVDDRVLIITYTDANYYNLINKIRHKNGGVIPDNIKVYTYFSFLFQECYKPFLSDVVLAKGINYEANKNRFFNQSQKAYYMDEIGRLYSNRIALLIEKYEELISVKKRIERYFDYIIIDEIQDISGRDFNFIEKLLDAKLNMMFVGDFFQHTYNTSADGNVNKSLFDDKKSYIKRFTNKGIVLDEKILQNSWRCGTQVCDYVREKLHIEIYSNVGRTGIIEFVEQDTKIEEILNDSSIVKLHYQNSVKYGRNHKNWGETKGEDCYDDVCVLLNKNTMQSYRKGTLYNLADTTRNKLYVALTRARKNVYIIDETKLNR